MIEATCFSVVVVIAFLMMSFLEGFEEFTFVAITSVQAINADPSDQIKAVAKASVVFLSGKSGKYFRIMIYYLQSRIYFGRKMVTISESVWAVRDGRTG